MSDYAALHRYEGLGLERGSREKLKPCTLTARDEAVCETLRQLKFATTHQLAELHWPGCVPRVAQLRLTRLFEAGDLDRLRPYAPRGAGSYPWTYHLPGLTVHDFGRVVHDLQVNGWVLAYRRIIGESLEGWLGEQDGTTAPPRSLPAHPKVDDWTVAGLRPRRPRPIRPDALLDIGEVRLFVELDRTRRPDKNWDKFERYDSFLTWWWRETEHAPAPGGPFVVFVCPDEDALATFTAAANERMTGRLQHPAAEPVFPGRKRTLFVVEEAVYLGDPAATRLPAVTKSARPTFLTACLPEAARPSAPTPTTTWATSSWSQSASST